MQAAVLVEDMRMAPHQFVGHGAERVLDPEGAEFSGDLRQQHAFEDVVPDLLAQGGEVASLDGVDHFVRLFEHELGQRLERLLSVPRAALGTPQRRDDFDKAIELRGGGHWSSWVIG